MEVFIYLCFKLQIFQYINMEIALIPPVLSIEFDNTNKFKEILSLEEKMNLYFKDRFYSDLVESYYIEFICISPLFRPFNKPQKTKYYNDVILNNSFIQGEKNHFYKMLLISMDVDFESFYRSDQIKGYNIKDNTLSKLLNKLKYSQAINSFDEKKFNNYLKDFFIQIGCTLQNN